MIPAGDCRRRRAGAEMHGILVVDKPEGVTSATVVRDIKRLVGGKVGHLGTLDPFASGVLPLCLGDGTKIAQFLNTADKRYEGVIRLGAQTDTGDRTGAVVRTEPVPAVTAAECGEVAQRFQGEQSQTPPMYSAIKRSGVPLYKLARRGIEVERAGRPITIAELALEPVGPDRLRVTVACSKGTYVRVLAEDIGAALGTVAHLDSLRRVRFGRFGLEHAVLPAAPVEDLRGALLSPRQALDYIPELHLDPVAAAQVCRGQIVALRSLVRPRQTPAAAKLIGPTGALLAVVVDDTHGMWQFARVLARR